MNKVKIVMDKKLAKQLFEEAPPKPDGLRISYVKDIDRYTIELKLEVVDIKGNVLVHLATHEIHRGNHLTIGSMYAQVPLIKLNTADLER